LAVVPDSGDYVRLDVPREWLLVKKLVNDAEIGVQFLFVSKPLEALLMDYARARGEPLELQHRAQTVMLQPGDSLPHDDHLHLRIACSSDEARAGCSGGGPYWEWLPPLTDAPQPDDAWLERVAAEEPFEDESTAPLASGAAEGGGA
jgi:penicillin-insensitive murein endopeptidase